MELVKGKSNFILFVKSVTWYKDSHSLFDYESTKINSDVFTFSLSTKTVTLYRKRSSCNVIALDQAPELKLDTEEYQFLTKFDVKPSHNSKIKINFHNQHEPKLKKINSQRLNTDQSISSINPKEEETYIIVRKQKDSQGEPKGYKLATGQTIKIGRVEFYVSEVCIGDKVETAKPNKDKHYPIKNTMKYIQSQQILGDQKRACKICLQENEDKDNFLFNPCRCSGSCGTVHLECLMQWINIKVKKDVIGGTQHYNFQKFECQVCKSELPLVVETENGENKQLLPIQKPKGSYLILQGACQKTKSVMMIKNVPEKGIKLGRGHECEIRITDISVSRNHALLKFINNGFYIFDNKSKFGTLLKEQKMNIEIGSRQPQSLQIGRTVITIDLRREKQITQKQIESTKEPERVIATSKQIREKDRR